MVLCVSNLSAAPHRPVIILLGSPLSRFLSRPAGLCGDRPMDVIASWLRSRPSWVDGAHVLWAVWPLGGVFAPPLRSSYPDPPVCVAWALVAHGLKEDPLCGTD